ncbi:MAG TPA: GatB/YqeY domain-containing protein [Candidatus Saccharimonadales bacterium]|nr:GatB/YqeY domain-containing protein [Candidatus Saccharimonadales bacterium]
MVEQIERDIKTALLAGDKVKAETLKTIKSALQYEAVAKKLKLNELPPEQIEQVLRRESKKRHETAQLYAGAGEQARADKEQAEKELIDSYLPEQLDETEVAKIVDEEVGRAGDVGLKDMGRLIGAVKARTGGQADGALIAKLVKEKLE